LELTEGRTKSLTFEDCFIEALSAEHVQVDGTLEFLRCEFLTVNLLGAQITNDLRFIDSKPGLARNKPASRFGLSRTRNLRLNAIEGAEEYVRSRSMTDHVVACHVRVKGNVSFEGGMLGHMDLTQAAVSGTVFIGRPWQDVLPAPEDQQLTIMLGVELTQADFGFLVGGHANIVGVLGLNATGLTSRKGVSLRPEFTAACQLDFSGSRVGILFQVQSRRLRRIPGSTLSLRHALIDGTCNLGDLDTEGAESPERSCRWEVPVDLTAARIVQDLRIARVHINAPSPDRSLPEYAVSETRWSLRLAEASAGNVSIENTTLGHSGTTRCRPWRAMPSVGLLDGSECMQCARLSVQGSFEIGGLLSYGDIALTAMHVLGNATIGHSPRLSNVSITADEEVQGEDVAEESNDNARAASEPMRLDAGSVRLVNGILDLSDARIDGDLKLALLADQVFETDELPPDSDRIGVDYALSREDVQWLKTLPGSLAVPVSAGAPFTRLSGSQMSSLDLSPEYLRDGSGLVCFQDANYRRLSFLAGSGISRPKAGSDDADALTLIRAYTKVLFSEEPYMVLATSQAESGRSREARRTLITMNDDECTYSNMPWLRQKWKHLTGVVVKYGYEVHRAALWLGITFAVACALVFIGQLQNSFIPVQPGVAELNAAVRGDQNSIESQERISKSALPSACDDIYPCFNAIVYTADTMIPIVNFHQNEFWQPRGAWWGRTLFVMLTVAAWLLTTILISGLSSLARREHSPSRQ
jgi:hypothetical protein